MDFDTVAGELYGLPPNAFTAARDRCAAEARRAGDKELARRIAALRRPTLAAWAVNLLARGRPDDIRSLAALGEALREAHRALDGAQLRDLTRQQRTLVDTLARQAAQLAAEAGHRLGDAAQRDTEATLQAALSDPESAQEVAAGRLATALAAPTGFPAGGDRARTATVTTLEAARERRRLREEAPSREREARRRNAEAETAERARDEALREVETLRHRLEQARARAEEATARAAEARARAEEAGQPPEEDPG
ncbi:hypothetical protein GCM10010218_07240 [Streptomyces mashuensis]|uniref:Uncharacterized protein n=1 Tax=Streptomyces mashuensis TaxID=33904 RepID=A0A919AY26_9ACTN|nr:hypothetical protein [Streptomyces mashuensis]GHF28653.1 hypothetical protein GCM10010218_07240 [Streptomyces mashuensis]